MQVKKVPATLGWRWVVEGFTILFKSPGIMLVAGLLLFFTLLITSALPIPLIGPVLPLLLTPALSFGFADLTREVAAGRKPMPFSLFAGLGPKAAGLRRELLLLGVFNATATLVALLLTQLVDGGGWSRLMTGETQMDVTTEVDVETFEAALVFMMFYAPFQAAFWFSPLFAGMHRVPAVKAIFYSIVSVWRNKLALIVYFAAWLVVAVGWSFLVRLMAAVVAPSAASMIIIPGLLVLMVALYSSFWPTYRDIVDPPPGPSGLTG